MEWVIREATLLDYEDLCELFDEADKLHRDHLSERFQEPNGPARDKEFMLDLLADQTVEVFVVESDGELLGLVQAAVKVSPPRSIFVPRCYVVVDTLVVKEDFRQQGLGQKLMDKVHHWAISKGASDVELNVYEFNQEANAFYRKLGYETISHKMSKSLRQVHLPSNVAK
jgi:diamine N-acetyltransferase